MKIIHYLHGLPPVRTGGLITYALDLAACQRDIGHEVFLLLPGSTHRLSKRNKIRRRESWNGIPVFRINNASPVPMGKGISRPQIFMRHGNFQDFSDFWQWLRPDVIHVHSLMGLYPELIEAASKSHIKTVFTTHDYFGLCCKPDRIDYQGKICNRDSWEECAKCGLKACSLLRMSFEQTRIFSFLMKNSQFADFLEALALRKKHLAMVGKKRTVKSDMDSQDYLDLQKQYRKLLQNFDIIHYNSRQSREIYHRLCPSLSHGYLISMVTAGIKDQRIHRPYQDAPIRLGFLGNSSYAKGLETLIEITDELAAQQLVFSLQIFIRNPELDRAYIQQHDAFSPSQADETYNSFDVLIVPSICEETFSLVVLEALSRGIPCIISDTVGAKDLLKQVGGGMVYSGTDGLKNALIHIMEHPQLLTEWNSHIREARFQLDFRSYVEELTSKYYK